jgi:hypothetical protein
MDVGVEITLAQPDDFLKVRETLTRIGVASKKDNTLYQSCHILHKRGKYAIVHFKEMFVLDGKPSSLDASDVARRNTICDLLQQWGLAKIVAPEAIAENKAPMSQIKIVSFKDKNNWQLVSKYNIGKAKP